MNLRALPKPTTRIPPIIIISLDIRAIQRPRLPPIRRLRAMLMAKVLSFRGAILTEVHAIHAMTRARLPAIRAIPPGASRRGAQTVLQVSGERVGVVARRGGEPVLERRAARAERGRGARATRPVARGPRRGWAAGGARLPGRERGTGRGGVAGHR